MEPSEKCSYYPFLDIRTTTTKIKGVINTGFFIHKKIR
jgi:hypothetical protein